MRLTRWLVPALLAASPAAAQSIGSMAAINHVNETVTVCGLVASAKVIAQQSVLLAFDYPQPTQRFSVLIQARDRMKFNGRELMTVGHRMCSTGTVKMVDGRAQMIIQDDAQLVPE
jgi:hypothetical protein